MRISKVELAGVAALAMGLCGPAGAQPASGPQSSSAKVAATIHQRPLTLKRPEQIALIFMVTIADLEDDCVRHADHACSMDELVNGVASKDHWPMDRLKFDPRTTDPNYVYTVNAGKNSWEARATPKKPGLGGFYFVQAGFAASGNYYNPKGEASISSLQMDSYAVQGESFKRR